MRAAESECARAIDGRNRQRLLFPLCWVLAFCACAIQADRAAQDLSRRGFPLDDRSFLEVVRSDDAELAQLYVEAGFKPDRALFVAAQQSACRAMKGLIEGGADIESLDGARALAFALARDHRKCVELLLAAGAELETPNKTGETLLHEAARQEQPKLLQFLIEKDLNLDVRSRTGETPLMVAVRVGRVGRAVRLAAAGADLEARDQDGWTVLLIAVRQTRPQFAHRLIELGADVNAVSDLGWSPLMWTSRAGQEDLVDSLLRAGADVDFASGAGHSALILAAQQGHVGIVERLLDAGADPDLEVLGGDALEWARALDRQQVAQLLELAAKRVG